jgi:hypothetical protein
MGSVALGLLLAAACAEEPGPALRGDRDQARAAIEARKTANTEVDVVFADSGLTVSATRVPTGAVMFQVRNAGTAPHALTVRGAQEEWSSLRMPPDEEVTMSIALPVGRYELLCPLTEGGVHSERGEHAVVEVY